MAANNDAELINKIKFLYSQLLGFAMNLSINAKTKYSYIDWLICKTELVKSEKKFDSTQLPNYRRGELIFLDLGFNVGEEYGGKHYAIVLRDSRSNHGKVLVLPITSQEPKSKHLPIYVEIGPIIGLAKDKHHWANILNITNVSKQRIMVQCKQLRVNDRVLNRLSGAIVSQIALR